MDRISMLATPLPLDPAWLAHEEAAKLLSPKSIITDVKERRNAYSQTCKNLNSHLLSTRDAHLNVGINIQNTCVPNRTAGRNIPIRSYNPTRAERGAEGESEESEREHDVIVVYYHGGGLYVGDLDSEDLACRRICKSLSLTVYSIGYCLLPDFTADDALSDALAAYMAISSLRHAKRWILAGSSSGGQLAAQVSQQYTNIKRQWKGGCTSNKICGVLLRGPVTCDATDGGANLPEKWRGRHTSMSAAFHTSLLSSAVLNSENRTTSPLPLEKPNLGTMPRHWIKPHRTTFTTLMVCAMPTL